MTIQQAYLAEFEQVGFQKAEAEWRASTSSTPESQGYGNATWNYANAYTFAEVGFKAMQVFSCQMMDVVVEKDCKYEHSMNSLSKMEKRERCYVCAKGHMSSNCPTKTKEQKPVVAAVQGDSPQSSTGGTANRKGQANGAARSETSTEAGSTAPSTATTSTTPVPTQLSEVQGVPVEQLLEDAQKLMKALMQQTTPTAKGDACERDGLGYASSPTGT